MRLAQLELYMVALTTLFSACGSDDGGGASAAVAAKLYECGLVSEGKINPYVADFDLAECRANCDVAGTCEELTRSVCRGQVSARTRDCYAQCLQLDCQDGRGTYASFERCNGRSDCADKSDESGCPAPATGPEYCAQSGARILTIQRCNGINECGDGTDEQGCPGQPQPFTCKTRVGGVSVSVDISMEQVCDLKPDCADGSDESQAQGCARLTCPPLGG